MGKCKMYLQTFTAVLVVTSIMSIFILCSEIIMSTYLLEEGKMFEKAHPTRQCLLYLSDDGHKFCNLELNISMEFRMRLQLLQQWQRQIKEHVEAYIEKKISIQRNTTNIEDIDVNGLDVSCLEILKKNPNTSSGYFWIKPVNGSSIQVYCDMTRTCGNVTGGWIRVYELNMTETSFQCPPGLCLYSSDFRACRLCTFTGSCSWDTFSVGATFSKVCGRVIGYTIGSVDGFSPLYTNVIDGVLVDYGHPSKNIWAFAAALSEISFAYPSTVCPCINDNNADIPLPPKAYRDHYFCDAATTKPDYKPTSYHTSNPLWDGKGCGSRSTCCSFNGPPWFFRELPEPTSENIHIKVCRNQERSNEDVAIGVVDIYVQ